ncbi:hypothetical protein DFH08DRAFT_831888 [Mycena albidolilacea]|uniref:Uncharacterized protein n=1 Tax=Mycena albidolilacea TaxID=1033008 RepID=A0AAD7F4K6_9AGAR|nr:hypothetical protein DFH08DRAFT_831888 [Mycena albidolilacea]
MSHLSFYLTFSFPYFPRRRIMDIHIILNPGAVGTPSKSNAQSNKKQPQKPQTPPRGSRTPTSVDNSPGPAIHRRSSGRTKTPSTRATPLRSYATPTPTPTRRSRPRQAPPSPLVRQPRPRKRVLELELGAEAPPKRRRRRSSTRSSRSSVESTATTASGAPSRASILLSRAKQHVALEAVALGRRSRSMMDVVMDLKGPPGELEYYASYLGRDYYDLRRDNNGEYVLTDEEGLAAYWADQAAIWMPGFHANDNNTSDSDSDWSESATRFPMSMERSTAAWEGDCL